MNKFCDLHTHSNYSDGTFSPVQLLDAAEAAGLSAVALTDHNTVSGLPAFLEAARGRGVEAVPGAEFSTDYEGTELHILGLFIGPAHFAAVTALMDDFRRRKDESNRELARALTRAGYTVDYEELKSRSPSGQINRSHFAGELVRLGFAATRQEAFSQFLSAKRGYYQPPQRIGAFEMIGVIRSMGAAAVLAHPFLNLKEEDSLRRFLGPAREAGLNGMEVLYPLFDEEQTQLASKLAAEFGLLPSGGSDFHGAAKPDIRLGCGKGNIAVPVSFLDGLKTCADYEKNM